MLEQLYRQYFPAMWRYAAKITGSDALADDVVQTAFLKLLQKEETLRTLDNVQLEAYIVITVKNTARNAIKSRPEGSLLPEELADNGTGQIQSRIADREAIEGVLPKLPPLYREVIALHYGMDLTFDTVAETLGISPEYARLVASRARAKLRTLLQEGEA